MSAIVQRQIADQGMASSRSQNTAAVDILRDLPSGFVLGDMFLARTFASFGRYQEAAAALADIPPDALLPGILEPAIDLLSGAPSAVSSPQSLPSLGWLEFVYLHVGAVDRILEYEEGNLEAGYTVPMTVVFLWHPSYAPLRKSERFNAFVRKIGLVDYWRVKGWPQLCHPTADTDFACE